MNRSTQRVAPVAVGAVLGGLIVGGGLRLWRRRGELALLERRFDDDVTDAVLADRVRSNLGQLEHQLDVPHVHVMVERHVALLHGDVTSKDAARAIETAALRTHGVRGVESHLHVGLLAGDTPPSLGGGAPSPAWSRLVGAAVRSGAGETGAPLAARAVLGSFAELLPEDVRRRLHSHLPADAALLLEPPRRSGLVRPVEQIHQLYASVVAADAVPPMHVPWVVLAVIAELQALVPDDAATVAAALPPVIRHLWSDASAEHAV